MMNHTTKPLFFYIAGASVLLALVSGSFVHADGPAATPYNSSNTSNMNSGTTLQAQGSVTAPSTIEGFAPQMKSFILGILNDVAAQLQILLSIHSQADALNGKLISATATLGGQVQALLNRPMTTESDRASLSADINALSSTTLTLTQAANGMISIRNAERTILDILSARVRTLLVLF